MAASKVDRNICRLGEGERFKIQLNLKAWLTTRNHNTQLTICSVVQNGPISWG